MLLLRHWVAFRTSASVIGKLSSSFNSCFSWLSKKVPYWDNYLFGQIHLYINRPSMPLFSVSFDGNLKFASILLGLEFLNFAIVMFIHVYTNSSF